MVSFSIIQRAIHPQRILFIVMIGLFIFSSINATAITRSSLNAINRQYPSYDPNAKDACATGGGVPGSGTEGSPESGSTYVAWNSGIGPPYIMEQYIIEVLKYIADFKQVPRENVVTEEHVAALLAFAWGEGGDIDNPSVFNLFNTSALAGTSEAIPYGNGGKDGRQAYINFDVGIKATGGTMLLPRYSRLVDALTNQGSTASQVLYNYAHYTQFPGNGWWAERNQIVGEEAYYQEELGYLKGMQNDYVNRASTIIGTADEEKQTGARDPSKLVYGGGVPIEDPSGGSGGTDGTGGASGSSGCVCSTSGDSGGSSNKDVTEEQLTAYNFYKSKGLSPQAAAGFVGNLVQESGPNLNTRANNGSHLGIVQWDSTVRWPRFLAWAAANKPADSSSDYEYLLTTQLQYSFVELSINYKSTYEKLSSVGSAKDAAIIILNEYEGAPGQQEAERIKFAEAVEKAGGSSSSTNSSCSQSGGGTAEVDGFTFPLITSKSTIKAGVDGAVWCYTKQENCHHDYPAADIHAPIGTSVIASKEGTVVLARDKDSSCGSSVAILGSDEQLYYYTHMQRGSIKVTKGQAVNSGDQLGEVGQNACGAAPHLHFDMLPKPNKNRPGCSGSACSGYPFLNVQPVLIKSFEALPEN